MFVSKKEFDKLKKAFEDLTKSHDRLAETVIDQSQEIYELKNPKKQTYMG